MSVTRQLICITAAQRAGTTALQHALQGAGIANFGEVFHPQPLKDAAGPFLIFAKENDIRITDTQTRSGARAIAQRYLSWLRELAGPRHFLIDVKFNSWCLLNPWWHYVQNEPLFLTHLKAERAVIVLVWRENLIDQLLSQFIALRFDIWHDLSPEKVAGRTCRVPVAWLTRMGKAIVRAEIDMLEHLRDYPAKVVMRYEDLFEEGCLSNKFRRALRQVSDIDLPGGSRVHVRQNSAPKREIVENYNEVIDVLRPLEERRSEIKKGEGRVRKLISLSSRT